MVNPKSLFGLVRIPVAACLIVVGSFDVLAAGKPSGASSSPCNAEFRNTGIEGVVDEGKGVYRNGVDGTRCQVDSAEMSGGADLLFTLNLKRSKTGRAAVLKLDNPVEGSLSQGVWTVSGLFHLHINEFGLVPVGTSIEHRVSFHVPYGGQNYKFRYRYEPNDGTAICRITRVASNVWTIESLDSHAARLWIGGSYGDPTVYPPAVGDYIAPFHLTITLQ